MQPKLTIDDRAFTEALSRWRKEVKGDYPKFMKQQAGLFVSEVIKQSYPKDPQAMQQGSKRLASDLKKAVYPMSDKPIKGLKGAGAEFNIDPIFDGMTNQRLKDRLNQLIRAKNHSKIQEILRNFKNGERKNYRVVAFSPSLHERARGSRGRTKHIRQMTPDAKEWKDYYLRKQKMVGLWKHGWTGAVELLRKNGIRVTASKFVTNRRPGKSKGSAKIKTSFSSWVLHMVNPYGYHKEADNITRVALQIRANTIMRGIDAVLERRARKAGFKTR